MGMSGEMKAAEMFAAGASVNAVATALCNGNWAKAKKAHDEWAQQVGAAIEPVKRGKRTPKPKANGKAKDADPAQAWTLTLELGDERLDAVLDGFTREEKAAAVVHVLQSRLDGSESGGEGE